MRRFVFCLAVLAAIAVLPAFADVNNGMFNLTAPANPFEMVGSGDCSTIQDWCVTQGTVDWIGNLWQSPPPGGNSIDLDGNTIGGISQDIVTVPGLTYLLSFWLAGNPAGPPPIKTLSVTASAASKEFTFDVTNTSYPDNMGWTAESFAFTAASPTTTIGFASFDSLSVGFNSGTPYYGPVVGDVSVSAVPEPAAILLMGTLLLGLAGALKRRA
jgi:choice-of-anchor C domain-containing protein